MDGRNHRELMVPPNTDEARVPAADEAFVSDDNSVIDVLEEERVIDVERP